MTLERDFKGWVAVFHTNKRDKRLAEGTADRLEISRSMQGISGHVFLIQGWGLQ